MALVDRRTDSIVLRIVYDGPPEAGKTTNLEQLCARLSIARRGELERPGTRGDRTQYFDWLDVAGGYIAGRRLRCQLVTVPGQIELARRRAYLLDTADVVVFVADARASALGGVRDALATLRRALAARGDVPLLVQANKQDHADALAPAALAGAVELAADANVIAAQANAGAGVLETFMLAVRLAVDRVRTEVIRGALPVDDAGTADDLLDALTAREAEAVQATMPPPAPQPAAPLDEPRALPGADVPAGLVWPPQRGRAALRDLDAARAAGAAVIRGAGGIVRCGGWLLAAAPQVWADLDLARRGLLAAIAAQAQLGDLAGPDRALALASDDGAYVLWHLAPAPRTLGDQGAAAAPPDALLAALAETCARARLVVTITPDTIDEHGARYLGPAWPGEPLDLATLRAGLAPRPPTPTTPTPPPTPPAPLSPPAAPAADDVVAIEEVDAPEPVDLVAPGLAASTAPPIDPATLPHVDLPAGLVWPLVHGRAALAALQPPFVPQPRPRSWAPADALELQVADGWILHTTPAWRFADLDAGRLGLVELVRWHVRLGAIAPAGRTFALCPGDGDARLWMITPAIASCWDDITDAFVREDRAALARAAEAAHDALAAVRAALARAGLARPVALDLIAPSPEPSLLASATTPTGDADRRLAEQLAAVAPVAVPP